MTLSYFLIAIVALLLGFILGSIYSKNKSSSIDVKQPQQRLSVNESEALKTELSESQNKIQKLEQELGSIKERLKDVIILDKVDKLIPATDQGQAISSKAKKRNKFDQLSPSNLQIIEGIGPKMESVLKDNGVDDWTALGNKSSQALRVILESYGKKYKIIDPDTWPEQAQMAASGHWNELIHTQKGIFEGGDVVAADQQSKVEKVMVKLGILKQFKQDDLKAIEGIGPKIAELLHRESIYTWEDLSITSVQTLQAILSTGGKSFQLADPSSWPKQARMAAEKDFDALTDYQDLLLGGK